MALLITLLTVAMLAAASSWASARYPAVARLPMQWSLTGRVIWSAPRAIALSLTPVLAALVMGAAVLFTAGSPDDGKVAVVFVVMAASFGFAHALHIWLIDRSLRRA